MNNSDFQNPFRAYRAEQLESLWKFYVNEPFDKYLSEKPLICEGGRGSGKTMFFKCNSWQQKFMEKGESQEALESLLASTGLVGFYYRVDATFIGSFYGKDVNEEIWDSVFSTYFNMIICKEILFFIIECIHKNIVKEEKLATIVKLINSKCGIDATNLSSCVDSFNEILDQIELFVNGVKQPEPRLFSIGRLIRLVIEELRRIEPFKDSKFHIFIDEYETLNKRQQIQINTLIKMSEYWLVYNIAVKNKGIKDFSTLTGEVIQEPHDFSYFRPEAEIEDEQYDELLKKICEKRFQQIVLNSGMQSSIPLDIGFYLGEYRKEEEISKIQSKIDVEVIKARIKEIIQSKVLDTVKQSEYFNELAIGDLISVRMNLCLLLREGEEFTVENIYKESLLYKKGVSIKYKNWVHNMSFPVIFLLVKEAKMRKEYYGLSVYAMLSSGVVRYFLELCEHAFDYAHARGFTFKQPRPLTAEEQSIAARYVSRYKITDIEWLKPYGKTLNRFILILGKIFSELHSNPSLTLGEPEHNHFHSKVSELDEKAVSLLDAALMHNILQLRLPTKEKEGNLGIETHDYFLNYIYCPYFEISYRRKRKLYISPDELKDLFNGDTSSAKRARKSILLRHKSVNSNAMLNDQFTFFGDE